MRLDKLTIGSPKDSLTHQFKNLKNVTIDFDQEHWVTIMIGWNGTGKSNVLEAIATIFRDLIAKKRMPAFAYKLVYRIGSGDNTTLIQIDADPDRKKDAFIIRVASPSDEQKIVAVQNPLQFDEFDVADTSQKLLLLDNDSGYCETVREYLELKGYQVYEASNTTEALDIFERIGPDLVITDIRSTNDLDEHDISGLMLAKQLPLSVPKLINSAYPSWETAREALTSSPFDELPFAVGYLSKSEGLEALLTYVKLALGKSIRFAAFVADDSPYLPRYVFSYYSGESTRMHDVYRPYLEGYDSKLRNGEDPGLKRLFYALPVHSQFVLLAFLIQQNDTMRNFLEEHLSLNPDEGIESVLFVLRQPPWKSTDGDPRFWYARGVVSQFLTRLYEIALAPVRIKRKVPVSLWNEKTLEFLYLYIKDIEALRRLVGNQPPAEFFRDLESTYVSELIEEVRIRVKLNKNDGSVTFRELSEGEQQLLTVMGLLRFTAGEESLFLLDEPDTHLNPRWSVDYLTYLKEFVGTNIKNQETSHIVLTTHNPLSIAELVKEQVQVLQLKRDDTGRHIIASHPDLDPRGQGYAAIVTSDMFGIASSLDKPTQLLLEKQRLYAAKKRLTSTEQSELDKLNKELDRLGFRFFHPDDEYSRYLRLRSEALAERFKVEGVEELAAQTVEMNREEREELADRLISTLNKGE